MQIFMNNLEVSLGPVLCINCINCLPSVPNLGFISLLLIYKL